MADGRYDLLFSGPGLNSSTQSNVEIADVTEATVAADATWNVGNANLDATLTSVGGSLSGTFGGTHTYSGNLTFSGTNSHSGTETFTNATSGVTTGLLNKTCYIDGTVWTSIQNAITNGTCGEINDRGVFSTTLGSLSITRQVKILLGPANYTFTGITASTAWIIDGLGNATFLQYTPTTGTAYTRTGTQPNVKGSGFKNLRMYGPGASTATTGMNYNMTVGNNAQEEHENFTMDLFGTGLTAATGVSGLGFTTFKHSSIFGNGQNINLPSGVSAERLEFIDSEINNTLAGTNWANCFSVASSSINIRVIGGAIDYCQLVVSAGYVELGDGTYIENTNTVLGTCTTASVAGCAISVSGTGQVTLTTLLALFSGSNSSFIGVTGNGFLNIDGGTLNATAGGGGAPISCVTGNGNLNIHPYPTLGGSTPYTSLWAGGCFTLGSVNTSGNTPNNALGIPAAATIGGSAADVAIARPNAAAGGKTWLCPVNAATGSFAGTAGDMYCYDGTKNWFEFGSGIGGISFPGATSGRSTLQAPATGGVISTMPSTAGTLAAVTAANTWTGVQSFGSGNILPSAAGGTDLGTTALPFGNLWLGTAATNNFKFAPAATAAARTITIPDPLGNTNLPLTIVSGTKALNTASITTATCDGGVAATATGTLSTDAVDWSFNAAPTATNKYGAFLVVYAVPSANTVTFYTCNPSATTSTPTAMTVNWSVRRP